MHCGFYTFKQRRLKNAAFLDKFKLKVEVIEKYGVELGVSATGIEESRNEVHDPNYEASVKALMVTNNLASALLLAADERRYSNILSGLGNDCMKGKKYYPKDVSATFKYLSNYWWLISVCLCAFFITTFVK